MNFNKQGKTPLLLKESKFDKIREYIEKPTDDDQWCNKIEIRIPNPLLKVQIEIWALRLVEKKTFFALLIFQLTLQNQQDTTRFFFWGGGGGG